MGTPRTWPEITPAEIEGARARLAGRIIDTPVVRLGQEAVVRLLPEGCEATTKLELFQHAGSFKARGALLAVEARAAAARAAGVVAASGGNHAMAVSWAAREAGLGAVITMPATADPVRIDFCRTMGAEVHLCAGFHEAFAEMDRIAAAEGRTVLHPFEAPAMVLGGATCGAEFAEQCAGLEVVILPVGGGGLIAGMAAAFKAAVPGIEVIGVEPMGADALARSFEAGRPVRLERAQTIADSLAAPMALPGSFALARRYVDAVVRVEDDELRAAMRAMIAGLKLMAEPACAASLAGLLGPLHATCRGKRVGLIACGSNIGPGRFAELVA